MTDEYADYLQTPHWKEFRKRALEHYGHKCRECGTEDGIMHVHHVTYENIGRELLEDVIILCKSCHFKEHFTHQPRKYKNPDCWHDNIEPMIFRDKDNYTGVWYCRNCGQRVSTRTLTPKEKRFIVKDLQERHKPKHKDHCDCEYKQVVPFDSLAKKYKKKIPSFCRCKRKIDVIN